LDDDRELSGGGAEVDRALRRPSAFPFEGDLPDTGDLRAHVRKRVEDVSGGLRVSLHEGALALRALEGPLCASGLLPAPVPEMAPEMLAGGFEGERMGALTAHRDHRLVGYMPYVLRRQRWLLKLGSLAFGWLPFRQLVIFGYSGGSEDHAPILDRLFEKLLQRPAWDVAQVFEWPLESPLSGYLAEAGRGLHGLKLRLDTYDTLQVDLEPSFDRYLARRFNKKTRYNLKREVRLMEEAVGDRLEARIFHSPDHVEHFFRDAERIARTTYQWRLGLPTVRATPLAVRKAVDLAARGQWRSYILYISDEPAAFCYGTIRWDELSYDTVGYDPRYAKLNPGKVLLFRILEDLHRTQTVRNLNFGRGITDYKKLFATSNRISLDASVFGRGFYPSLLHSLDGTMEFGYRWLHPRLRHWMPAVKRFAGRMVALLPVFQDFLLLA
jgi:hypothetical protein